jgi:hypothetical protein
MLHNRLWNGLVIGFGLGAQVLVRRRFVSTAATVNLHTGWYVGS